MNGREKLSREELGRKTMTDIALAIPHKPGDVRITGHDVRVHRLSSMVFQEM
jgi:hypothetical protein